MAEANEGVRVEQAGHVARVWLDREAKRNAFDDALAGALGGAFAALAEEPSVRCVVLGGEGPVFCAGGDLAWMQRVADYDREANLADAAAFQQAFERIDRFPVPVVGRVQGAALGGGVGLVAACDVVVAAAGTAFAFPEARLGLVPGVVAPFVLAKIGPSHARRLFVTGARIDAEEALRIGLVHQVAPEGTLDEAVGAVVRQVLACAPGGVRRAKRLVFDVLGAADAEAVARVAREAIAQARASGDGREGTAAFLEKRKPRWLA